MEAEAIHDFNPSEPATELAFAKGDRLLILNYGDPVQWFNAEMNGQKGLVPGNYIHIERPSWYMGRISRATAEHMLRSNRNEGAFLVRLSESSPSDFSLSVKCDKSVQHFRILKDEQSKYFLWSTRFDSLNELVNHYKRETVSRTTKILLRDIDEDDQFVVITMYDFEAQQENPEEDSVELSFKPGELITVYDHQDENWWGGCIGDRTGYFPKSYVERYDPIKIPPL